MLWGFFGSLIFAIIARTLCGNQSDLFENDLQTGEIWKSNLGGNRTHDRGQKISFLPRVVPWFPLLGLTPSGLFMGSISTLIYTSELILCFTICVLSATRHNIHCNEKDCLLDIYLCVDWFAFQDMVISLR